VSQASVQITLPFFAMQSASLGTVTQPWPVQVFMPAQPLVLVAHSEWPLQVLMPSHLTVLAGGIATSMPASVALPPEEAPPLELAPPEEVPPLELEPPLELVDEPALPPSTVPFFASHSDFGTLIQPWPLHSFMPLQPLPPEPPEHSEVPLQVLMPAHFTSASFAVATVDGAPVPASLELQATKSAAMDPAKSVAEPADLMLIPFMLFVLSRIAAGAAEKNVQGGLAKVVRATCLPDGWFRSLYESCAVVYFAARTLPPLPVQAASVGAETQPLPLHVFCP
jgi:hypothetical protein